MSFPLIRYQAARRCATSGAGAVRRTRGADLYTTRLGRLRLRDYDRKQAVDEVGGDAIAVYELGETHRALEVTGNALRRVDAELVLCPGVEREGLVTAYGE